MPCPYIARLRLLVVLSSILCLTAPAYSAPSLAILPESVQLSGPEAWQQLLAEASLDGRQQDWTDRVEWSSSDPNIATVAAAGGLPTRSGEVKIWDVASSGLRLTIQGHADTIYATVFSPDGSILATSSYDRLIKLWDVDSGKELRTLKDHIDAVYSLAFTPDGKWLLSGAADRTETVSIIHRKRRPGLAAVPSIPGDRGFRCAARQFVVPLAANQFPKTLGGFDVPDCLYDFEANQ